MGPTAHHVQTEEQLLIEQDSEFFNQANPGYNQGFEIEPHHLLY
jgi:hypothetical protein